MSGRVFAEGVRIVANGNCPTSTPIPNPSPQGGGRFWFALASANGGRQGLNRINGARQRSLPLVGRVRLGVLIKRKVPAESASAGFSLVAVLVFMLIVSAI